MKWGTERPGSCADMEVCEDSDRYQFGRGTKVMTLRPTKYCSNVTFLLLRRDDRAAILAYH
jgi:hypothetical protein